MKYLLPSVFETEEDAPFSPTKVQSCRFPMKIRYLTIICPPIEGETDGKVLLLRVSHKELTKRAVGHQKFVSNFLLNQGILVNGNESFQIQLTSLLMSFLLQFQNITIWKRLLVRTWFLGIPHWQITTKRRLLHLQPRNSKKWKKTLWEKRMKQKKTYKIQILP